jgi:transposase
MEHLGKEQRRNSVKPNGELNKSKAPQRVSSLNCEPDPARPMVKPHSVNAWSRLLMETAHTIIRSVVAAKAKEVPLKKNIKNYVGIDIASETLAISVFQSPDKSVITRESIANNEEGFKSVLVWFEEINVTSSNSVVCMEATGVYGEAVSYYLIAQGFRVAIEPPLKVKRAFEQYSHKTDAVDSAQIAEYAYRFFDELRYWHPPTEVTEKIKHFLAARELLTKQSVATQNALTAYKRHVSPTPTIIDMYQKNLALLREQIATIDQNIKELMKANPSLHEISLILMSLCGVGVLLSAYLIVTSNAFQNITDFKQMAAFIGICPYQHKSGKSIYLNAHSRHFGPAYIRKLLHLAARSVATHNPEFKKYYWRKIEEGKSKKIALNNIANKLLKISFALVRNRQKFIKGYRSINPLIFQNT